MHITWERGNGSIALDRANGINSNILTLINLQPEDAGEYRCVVKNLFYGNCSSDYATMTIKGNYNVSNNIMHTYSQWCTYLAISVKLSFLKDTHSEYTTIQYI